MGARMVRNLVAKGQTVRVYDIAPTKLEGVQTCSTPEEAVKDAAIIITMLPNGHVVKDTVLGERGILKGASKNALLVDSSTIEPKHAQELSQIASENKLRFIDAPVSGGIVGAAAGTLTFMVGGAESDVREAEPVLLHMGAKVFHCGQSGAGQIAKICNNLILGSTMIATAEGFNLGIKLGLDPKVLNSIVNISTGRSWSSDTYNPVPGIMKDVPSSNNYEGGFLVKLIAKDLGLAENAALSCGAPVPLTAITHQLYRSLMVNGYGDKDFAYIYQFLKGK